MANNLLKIYSKLKMFILLNSSFVSLYFFETISGAKTLLVHHVRESEFTAEGFDEGLSQG